MKAEELMLGDWVVYDGDTEYDAPIKIEGMDISTNSLITSDREDVGFDGVQPIPITPEILEKNGFTYYGESWYIPHNGKNKRESVMVGFHMYCTVIAITKGNNNYYKEVPCKYRSCAENRCVYVHELQHAIRLCGINKTIEL